MVNYIFDYITFFLLVYVLEMNKLMFKTIALFIEL